MEAFCIDEETKKSFVNSCKKGNCSLKTDGIKRPYKIIDLDKPGSPLGNQEKRCDYLLLVGGQKNWVMPIELKGGRVSLTNTAAQLQAAADYAGKKIFQGHELNFCPILVCGSLHSYTRNRIKDRKIRFRGKEEKIRVISCGQELTSIQELKFLS